MGDFLESFEDFSKSIDIDPNYAIAHRNRGKSRIELNQIQDACIDFEKALELGDDAAIELLKIYCGKD
jgi:tetratricopeptide (TPR) repeat protein